MKIKKLHLIVVFAGLLIVSFAILFVVNRPTTEELLAEKIINSYIESKGLNIRQGTDEYKILIRKIIWGEVPELTEIGAGYINSQEEQEYVVSYAWAFSGYKEAYGNYYEPDREEANLPTSTEPSTEVGEQIIATAMVALLDGQIYAIDGCVWVKNEKYETDYILVWPPDAAVNINGNQITIRTGIVRGKIEETVLQNGDWVLIGGGETSNLSNELSATIPPPCIGSYWVVGFSVEKLQSPSQ